MRVPTGPAPGAPRPAKRPGKQWDWEIHTIGPDGGMYLNIRTDPAGDMTATIDGYLQESADMRVDPAQFEAMCRSYLEHRNAAS